MSFSSGQSAESFLYDSVVFDDMGEDNVYSTGDPTLRLLWELARTRTFEHAETAVRDSFNGEKAEERNCSVYQGSLEPDWLPGALRVELYGRAGKLKKCCLARSAEWTPDSTRHASVGHQKITQPVEDLVRELEFWYDNRLPKRRVVNILKHRYAGLGNGGSSPLSFTGILASEGGVPWVVDVELDDSCGMSAKIYMTLHERNLLLWQGRT